MKYLTRMAEGECSCEGCVNSRKTREEEPLVNDKISELVWAKGDFRLVQVSCISQDGDGYFVWEQKNGTDAMGDQIWSQVDEDRAQWLLAEIALSLENYKVARSKLGAPNDSK